MHKRNSIFWISFLALIGLVIIGSIIFHITEHWDMVDSIYFSVMTITTVGHGDMFLTSNVSKMLASLYSLLSIPVVLFIFGIITESYFETRLKGLEKRLRSIMLQEHEIEEAIVETEEKLESKTGL